jgi:hypothetical protein
MSAHYLAERIKKDTWFSISKLIRGRGNRGVTVIGFDSEQDTRTGRPMLFQYSRVGEMPDVELQVIGERERPLDRFMMYVHEVCTRKDTEYIILGWNLQYEFTQLFPGISLEITSEPEFIIDYTLNLPGQPKAGRYTIRVANDKRYFIKIRNEATHRTITFADGMAFYVTSLDNAAKMLGLGRKMKVVTKRFTRADLESSSFVEYAKQDAFLTRKIGENIVDLHEKYDVTTCLTAPQFASKVFRHHFLNATIAPPDPDLEQAGLWSYHGGKNGYYLPGPHALANVYAFDITSAYPEAMRQLPNVETSEWHYALGYEKGVAALWKIRARYTSCTYHGLMTHGNSWHETGEIEGWTTSYELDAAVDLGEIEIIEAEGWIMRGDPGGALVAYVDTFFDMKRKATGALREAAKLFLNSLYGKFFQKVPLGIVGTYEMDANGDYRLDQYVMTDPTQEYDWQAGGLYHPPIASLITGFVRAKIHRLEHKYKAVMTSTDGFFGLLPPDPDDIGTDLGKLTVERGSLRIWRERLYVFTPSILRTIETGGKLKRKYALHGFRGTLRDLVRLPLQPGKYVYTAQAMITNKLARNAYHGTRYAPGVFVRLPFTLDLTAHAPP